MVLPTSGGLPYERSGLTNGLPGGVYDGVYDGVHDAGFNDISYHARQHGNDTNIIETPHLDALAATGIKLENYYIQPVWPVSFGMSLT